jgi:hypothetical protein
MDEPQNWIIHQNQSLPRRKLTTTKGDVAIMTNPINATKGGMPGMLKK